MTEQELQELNEVWRVDYWKYRYDAAQEATKAIVGNKDMLKNLNDLWEGNFAKWDYDLAHIVKDLISKDSYDKLCTCWLAHK